MRRAIRSRPRSSGDESHSLPLINIVFLLLAFFLMAGQIVKRDPVLATLPQSVSEGVDDRQLPTVQIDVQGHLTVDGKPATPADLKALYEATQADTRLRIYSDADAPASAILAILGDIRRYGWIDVVLVTQRIPK